MEETKEKTWCVYKHTSPSGKVYIGITCKKPPELRWSNGNGYKREHPHFWNAIQKYGWNNFKHEILFDGLSREDACKKEQETIALYDATNPEKGYNQTKGGDGKCGYIMSDETKKKMSESRIGRFTGKDNPNYENHKLAGKNNPFYGKQHTEETKNKMRELATGRESPMKGKYFSEEVKEHMKQGSKSHIKSVLQFDLNGVFINRFNSLTEAANSINANKSDITACCSGKTHTSHGFFWLYEENYNKDIQVEVPQRKKRSVSSYFSKPILQYTMDDIFVNEFISSVNASKQTGINVCCIRDCCNGRQKSAGGFIWRYKYEEN